MGIKSIKINVCNIIFIFSLNVIFSATLFAESFNGTWVLEDTKGDPFEIQLKEDGSATGTHDEDMKYGSWEKKDEKVFIYWGTGWITVIGKQGDNFIKEAFKPGDSLEGKPTNTSSARKK
jgi:hypothetical protein